MRPESEPLGPQARAHGLEVRAPFLDVPLVEFTLGLPWQMRFQGDVLKPLLRDACGDLWPEALANRPKQGFAGPLPHWVQRPDGWVWTEGHWD